MKTRPFAPVAVYGAGFFLVLAAILTLNHGRFCYTLDDPYIHLTLAGNILNGGYGLKAGEPSSPSSSILWPLLLAPLSPLSFFEWVPLGLNALFSLLALLVFLSILGESLSGLPHDKRRAAVSMTGIFFVPAANLLGLAFSGMEHSLQILLSLLLVHGLVREENGSPAPWLGPVLILGPLVRYENLALSLPALLYLVFRAQWRRALLWALLLLSSLSLFSLFLLSRGLGWLPASILWKSNALSGALLPNLVQNLTRRQGWILAGAGLALFLAPRGKNSGAPRVFALGIGLHLLFGALGRYESYLSASLPAVLIHAFRDPFGRLAEKRPRWRLAALLTLFAAVACGHYVKWSFLTPLAANNIYEQHVQLRRFVDDYWRAPVAAGDIGVLSYRAHFSVTDLGGLADRTVQRFLTDRNAAAIDSLAAAQNARLALVYREFFRALPPSWILVAELSLGKPRLSPAGVTVSFFAVDAPAAAQCRGELRRFQTTLPQGVALRIFD